MSRLNFLVKECELRNKNFKLVSSNTLVIKDTTVIFLPVNETCQNVVVVKKDGTLDNLIDFFSESNETFMTKLQYICGKK